MTNHDRTNVRIAKRIFVRNTYEIMFDNIINLCYTLENEKGSEINDEFTRIDFDRIS